MNSPDSVPFVIDELPETGSYRLQKSIAVSEDELNRFMRDGGQLDCNGYQLYVFPVTRPQRRKHIRAVWAQTASFELPSKD